MNNLISFSRRLLGALKLTPIFAAVVFAVAVSLLGAPERWSLQRLRAEIATDQTRTLRLKRRIPILLLYRTVDVDDRGTVHFRPDFYGRDAALAAALTAPVGLPGSM